jgi:hypothetical protein
MAVVLCFQYRDILGDEDQELGVRNWELGIGNWININFVNHEKAGKI